MENEIKQIILSCGADVCGISSIDKFCSAPDGFSPKDIFESCKSIITFGKALTKGLTKVSSRLIYGHFNYLTCTDIDTIALNGAKRIEEQFEAMAAIHPMNIGKRRR